MILTDFIKIYKSIRNINHLNKIWYLYLYKRYSHVLAHFNNGVHYRENIILNSNQKQTII